VALHRRGVLPGMTAAVLACIVCARPLDALLTSGLHAGVLVLAAVAVVVVGAIGRAGWRLLRAEARATE
jgi:hypothetical protein